jgi:hypothetical protein
MSHLLSISFKDFSFRNDITKYFLEKFKIKSIEYEKDFDWIKTNKQDVFDVETSQIKFSLKVGGQLLIQNLNNSLPRIFGSKVELETAKDIMQYSELLLLDSIVDGQIHDYLDYGLQNNEEVKYWKLFGINIPSYIEIFPNPNYVEGAPGMDMIVKEFISIESLPGHIHQMSYDEKLWFGSCWLMYFSPVYYKYIPKFLFDDFQDCFEHKVFENGLRRITLFENPVDYDLPENRAKQWAFRRAIGIDSIAHELTKQNNRIEPKNLPVIISKQNCSKGTTRVEIKKGIEITVKEFLDDGVTLVLEEIKTT